MPAAIDLQKMSAPDKLRLIEAGEEKFVDWETAKRHLREELQ